MATLVVNQGLQRIAVNASQAVGFTAARFIQCLAVDNATGAFAAAHTKLNDGAGFSVSHAEVLDSTPSIAAQTVTHIATLETGDYNNLIRRISLHDDTAANVGTAGTTTTLVGGIDGQTLQKTVDFSLAITVKITYTSA